MRTLLIVVLVALGAFSVYGFLASAEPGVAPEWRLAYGLTAGVALVAAAALQATRPRASDG